MDSFKETGLNPEILAAVEELGFETPTPIQAKAIPLLLSSNQDLIALAQTGTGKTAAFGLPAIHCTDLDDPQTQTLVLCPTRELCIQIAKDIMTYAKYSKGLGVVPVYGGTSIDKQIRDLKKKAQIVVGTPGRVKDLIKRKKLKVGEIDRVVLDEADEMLTMGFKDELDAILSQTPADKQTLLFSATISKEISRIAQNYMQDPLQISVAKLNKGADNVKHLYYMVHARNRYEVLKRIADSNPNIYGIVFCRTRIETKEVANKLTHDGYSADAIHGDLSQAQRDDVMGKFRKRGLQLLVATDVAARGLDVNDLTHVINYNLPDNSEIYVHRSGRTGRAGKSGISIAIIHTREGRRITDIERRAGVKFSKERVPDGKEICQKQLLALIDRIEKVEVDEKQIGPFLPAIYDKLESLSREDLIKHFVSAEFNSFLDYYKNAKDINIEERGRRDRGDRDGRSERRGRDGRSERRSREDRPERRGREDRWERAERTERADRTDEPKSRSRNDRRSTGFARIFINLGTKQDLDPTRLISLINRGLKSSDAEIGKIEILKKFSFFEIDEHREDQLIAALNGKTIDGTKLLVETSADKPAFVPPVKKKKRSDQLQKKKSKEKSKKRKSKFFKK